MGERHLSRRQSRLLILMVVVITIIAVANFVLNPETPPAFGGVARPSRGMPAAAAAGGLRASANGTTNSTTPENKTLENILNQINLLWSQFFGGNGNPGVFVRLANLEADLFWIIAGIVALTLILIVGFALTARYVRRALKEMREEKVGPMDPNFWLLFAHLMDRLTKDDSEVHELVDTQARAELQRLVTQASANLKRQGAAARRVRVPGAAGPGQEE